MTDLFRNELKSYKGYLEYRNYLKEKIAELQHDLEGLKAVRYDKTPSTFNQEAYELHRLGLIEKKDKYEGELIRVNMNIAYIEKKLEELSEDDYTTAMILVNNETYEKAGERLNYSVSGIQYQIKKLMKHNKFIQ